MRAFVIYRIKRHSLVIKWNFLEYGHPPLTLVLPYAHAHALFHSGQSWMLQQDKAPCNTSIASTCKDQVVVLFS